MTWFNHVRNAMSQLLNAVTGGHEDETTSSRTGKQCYWDQSRWGCLRAKGINLLFWDRFHCWNAIEVDEGYRLDDVPEWWQWPHTRESKRLAIFGEDHETQFKASQGKAIARYVKRNANKNRRADKPAPSAVTKKDGR